MLASYWFTSIRSLLVLSSLHSMTFWNASRLFSMCSTWNTTDFLHSPSEVDADVAAHRTGYCLLAAQLPPMTEIQHASQRLKADSSPRMALSSTWYVCTGGIPDKSVAQKVQSKMDRNLHHNIHSIRYLFLCLLIPQPLLALYIAFITVI